MVLPVIPASPSSTMRVLLLALATLATALATLATALPYREIRRYRIPVHQMARIARKSLTPNTSSSYSASSISSSVSSSSRDVRQTNPIFFSDSSRVFSEQEARILDSSSNYIGARNSADGSDPTAAATLSYMDAVGGTDICYHASRAYVEAVLGGGNGEVATAAAEKAYKAALAAGFTVAPGSACAASEVAFKTAAADPDKNAVFEAANAFMSASPPTPCGQAGVAYMRAITSGMAPRRANLMGARAFLDATTNSHGADAAACQASSKAFLASLGGESNTLIDAMNAFTSAGAGVDPVCMASAGAFIDAKIERASDEEAINKAAKAYILALSVNPGAGSGCLASAFLFMSP